MKKRDKYFLYFAILIASLFAFGIFSVLYCVLNSSAIPEAKKIEHTMSFVYLIIHLCVLGAVFYFTLKAYFLKPMIVSVIMTYDKGGKNPKSYRNSMIFAVIFGLAGIYFALNAFNALTIMKFFSLGLNITLTNVFISVSLVALYLFFYKPVEKKEIEVK